jgi:ATP-binding cassette subfamily B protein
MIPHSSPARFLAHYAGRRSVSFIVLLALIGGASICAVAVQYGMKLIVDAMSTGDRGNAQIWMYLSFFIALIATECLLWRLGGWLGCRTVVATGVDVRLDLMEHLLQHPLQYFSVHLSGSLGSRITATAGAVGAVLGTLAWRVLPPCVDFVGAVIIFMTLDWRMAIALIVFVGVVSLAVAAYGAAGHSLQQAYAKQASQVGGELVDVVANVWTVKAFSAREREYRRLSEAMATEARAQTRSWLHLEKARVLHDICLCVMAGSMLVWAVFSWRAGNSSAGDVVLVSALTFRILHGSRDLALAAVETTQQWGVIGEMLKVVAQPHRVADDPNAVAFKRGGGAISLKNVRFKYLRGKTVFDGFDLEIPSGQRVGIVGPSGAGKSTLVALIQRLDDVQAGEILIDGQPVTSVTQDSLREAIAVVPQEIALLHRSVRENIRYGRPSATDEEVQAAAAAAFCDEFIATLPDGFDTIVGERGTRLSGGQRQRIGLARAFLKDAPILLLDEATSSLDSTSEAKIQVALARLMRGRTVLAVAHRLSTVASFDRVVVVVDGKVQQDGPPAELRKQEGVYGRLWQIQAEGFEAA